jgi:hypothetical protein
MMHLDQPARLGSDAVAETGENPGSHLADHVD